MYCLMNAMQLLHARDYQTENSHQIHLQLAEYLNVIKLFLIGTVGLSVAAGHMHYTSFAIKSNSYAH